MRMRNGVLFDKSDTRTRRRQHKHVRLVRARTNSYELVIIYNSGVRYPRVSSSVPGTVTTVYNSGTSHAERLAALMVKKKVGATSTADVNACMVYTI